MSYADSDLHATCQEPALSSNNLQQFAYHIKELALLMLQLLVHVQTQSRSREVHCLLTNFSCFRRTAPLAIAVAQRQPSMASQDSSSVAGVPAPVLDAAAKKLERRKRFEAVFPLIKQELLDYLDECKMPSDARAWFDRVSYLTRGTCWCGGQTKLTTDPVDLLLVGATMHCRISNTTRLGVSIAMPNTAVPGAHKDTH